MEKHMHVEAITRDTIKFYWKSNAGSIEKSIILTCEELSVKDVIRLIHFFTSWLLE